MLRWIAEMSGFSKLIEKITSRQLGDRLVDLPKPPPLTPTFSAPESLVAGEFSYNPDFYADEETSKKIMTRFNAMVVFMKAIRDGEGYAPSQWYIRFSDWLEINTGQLAKYFAFYPEEKYPGVAVNFGIQTIALHRQKAWEEKELERRRQQAMFQEN